MTLCVTVHICLLSWIRIQRGLVKFPVREERVLLNKDNFFLHEKCYLLWQQLIGMNWTNLRQLPFITVIFKQRHISLFLCKSLTFFLASFLFSQCYSSHAAYCHSKLAQLLFSSHLHQEMQHGGFPVSSCAVDPGMVDTALYRHLWTPLRLAQRTIAHLLLRVKHCSEMHLLLHTHQDDIN